MVVSAFRKQPQERQGVSEAAAAAYVVDTLLCCAAPSGANGGSNGGGGEPTPADLAAENAEMQVGWCGTSTVPHAAWRCHDTTGRLPRG